MKQLVRKFCGDDAADAFKASKFWHHDMARRFGICLRRKSNAKAEPVDETWYCTVVRRRRRRGKISPDSLAHLEIKAGDCAIP